MTEYKTLETGNGFTYVEVHPKTGRTHQIRVHFKSLQHPIVGDSLYAPNLGYSLGFERLALHAFQIEFTLLNGKSMKIEAPLPADFKKGLKMLRE